MNPLARTWRDAVLRAGLALSALFVVASLVGCASIAPGSDPVVVNTERTLKISVAVYDTGLDWVRANAATLSPSALAIAEKVRVEFPPAYRAVDTALQAYKGGKAGDFSSLTMNLLSLIDQLSTIVAANGGPDVKAVATAKAGG